MPAYPGKRTLDLVAACAACVTLAPLVVGIAIATWAEDGGAPLFLQTRVGCGRRPFTVVKFRTMAQQRVTRVGAVLRRTGLDELPQFINVWRGEMSMVGPRPLTPADVVRLGWHGNTHDWRFAVPPGITGIAQLLAGSGARTSLRLDRLYLQRQSLGLDVQLITLSFAANLLGKRRIRRWLRRLR
jgi:lipopolysaccharide/colanic/teichoic acid biosynthesis glycosyltransferase